MVDAGKVSAVELDIKDEGGIVGYDSDVEMAKKIGAVRQEYYLEDAIDLLHAKGVRVIGRIVAFRDGPLARWASENDRMDMVIQDNDGDLLSKYGGFTNVANADVRQYNIDLAEEAIDRGVDEILWDYVRRPEGDIEKMVLPRAAGPRGWLRGPGGRNDTVVSFLAEAAKPLRERCVYQGASLFGVAARNPDAIGQPVPGIARNVDYIAPMLYPSHWVRGEYRVDHPNAQPYDIVTKALSDFQRKAAGSGVAFVSGCRTSRSASRTDRPRSVPRSTPHATSAWTTGCCGTPPCATRPTRSPTTSSTGPTARTGRDAQDRRRHLPHALGDPVASDHGFEPPARVPRRGDAPGARSTNGSSPASPPTTSNSPR